MDWIFICLPLNRCLKDSPTWAPSTHSGSPQSEDEQQNAEGAPGGSHPHSSALQLPWAPQGGWRVEGVHFGAVGHVH